MATDPTPGGTWGMAGSPTGYGFNNTLLAAFYVTPNVAGVDFYTDNGVPWNVSNSTHGYSQFGFHYGGGRTDYVQLSLPAGTIAMPGQNVPVTGTGGGIGQTGGSSATFGNVTSAGTLSSTYYTPSSASDLATEIGSAAAGSATFRVPGSTNQVWDLAFDGSFTGSTTVAVHFDPTLLGGVNPADLVIYHWNGTQWIPPPGQVVDPVGDTITFTTDSFSPFMLGEVPEPGTLVLLGIGALGLLACARRERSAFRFHFFRERSDRASQTGASLSGFMVLGGLRRAQRSALRGAAGLRPKHLQLAGRHRKPRPLVHARELELG